MNYTDTQLKQALAKMLPEHILCNTANFRSDPYHREGLFWRIRYDKNNLFQEVLDTELLHLCWLVEETLGELDQQYYTTLGFVCANYGWCWHATWHNEQSH